MAMLPIAVGALAGMCICSGLHHLIHGLHRPYNRASLLFSLVCLFITAYTLSGPLATLLLDGSITQMSDRWPLTWLLLATSASVWFLFFYADIRQRRLPLLVSIVSLLVAVINMLVPSLSLIALMALPAIGLIGLSGYAIYRLYRANIYRSAWVLAGSLFLGLALAGYDLLIDQWLYNLPYLFAYASPILLLIISSDLSARSTHTAYLTSELAMREAQIRGEQEALVARRTRQLRRRAEELAGLNTIARKIATISDVPLLLQQVSETLRAIFQAHGVLVTLLDSHKTTLKVVIAATPSHEGYAEISEATFALADYPAARQALEQGEPVMVDDAQTSALLVAARDILGRHTIQSVLLVPLRSQGVTIGLLTLTSDRPGMVFGRDEIALAETSASSITAIIENACLQSSPPADTLEAWRQRAVKELDPLGESH